MLAKPGRQTKQANKPNLPAYIKRRQKNGTFSMPPPPKKARTRRKPKRKNENVTNPPRSQAKKKQRTSNSPSLFTAGTPRANTERSSSSATSLLRSQPSFVPQPQPSNHSNRGSSLVPEWARYRAAELITSGPDCNKEVDICKSFLSACSELLVISCLLVHKTQG